MRNLLKSKKFSLGNDILLCALDLGKTKHSAYYRLPDGRDIKPFFIENNRTGFNKFWQQIILAKKKHSLKEIVLAYESTSCYWEPIIHQFASKGIRIVQINPMHTKRLKELKDNSPTKSDHKDPLVIADIVELGNYLKVVIPKGVEAEIRRLIDFRETVHKDRTKNLNRLEKLVHRIFPEFLTLMKGLTTKTAQYLIRHYPLPEQLVKLGIKRLAKLMYKVSRGRIKPQRAEELVKAAKETIGIGEGLVSIRYQVTSILEDIERADARLESIEANLVKLIDQVPYSQYILSIKGVGLVGASTIIGEVGDFSKYRKSHDLIKLAGLNLCDNSSGKRQGKIKISKRGRSTLRHALYFIALSVVRWVPIFKDYYERCLERKMPKMKALIAVCRKFMRVIFALVKNETMFDPTYMK